MSVGRHAGTVTWVLLLVLLLALVLHYRTVGDRSLCTGDEAITALRSLGLLEEGHLWTPYFDGDVDLHKPPLYYWLVALTYRAIGITEAAVRLPSVLSFLVLVVLVYLVGRRIFDPWTGLLSAVLLAAHPFAATHARVGMLDTTMVLFSFGAAWCLLRAADGTRWLYGWGLCCGLALLTKGEAATPIGVASVLFILIRRHNYLRLQRFYLGLVFAAVLPAIWFGSEYLLHREALLGPHVGDFVDYRLKHNIWKSLFVYQKPGRALWASWGGLAPLWFASPILLRLRRGTDGSEKERDVVLLYLLVLVPLIMIGLVRQQLYWYCLPMVPPLAILGAAVLMALMRGRFTGVPLAAAGLLVWAGTFLPSAYPEQWALLMVVRVAAGGSVLVGAAGMAYGRWHTGSGAHERRVRWIAHAGGAAVLGAAILAMVGAHLRGDRAVRLHRELQCGLYRQLGGTVQRLNHDHLPVVVNFRHYRLNTFMFYGRCRTIQIREFARRPIGPGRAFMGLIWGAGYEPFLAGLQVDVLETTQEFSILSISNATTRSVIPAEFDGQATTAAVQEDASES